jgi:hypothetical protein
MIEDEWVSAHALAGWVRETEGGIERYARKGLLRPNKRGEFRLKDAIRAYAGYWQKLVALVESKKERFVSTAELGEFLLLDRDEIAQYVLAGVFSPEADDRFALLTSTKAYATEVNEGLGRKAALTGRPSAASLGPWGGAWLRP